MTIDTRVHHLYKNGPALDLVPICGICPGPDPETGEWHTGHAKDLLLEYMGAGQLCCSICVSPDALGEAAPAVAEAEGGGFAEDPNWDDDDPW